MSNLAPAEVPRFLGGPLPENASTPRVEFGFSRLARGLGNVAYRMVAQTSNVDARPYSVDARPEVTLDVPEQPAKSFAQLLETEVVWLEH